MKSLISTICLLALSGCVKIGPHNLKDDSMSYNHAVHSSVDRQLLLNMVRLRYRDNPTFLQVGIISSSYEFRRSLGLDTRFDATKSGGFRLNAFSLTPKASVDYNEKPTITYNPVRGEAFSKEMLAPVSMGHIMLLHTSGWKIDRILRTTVQRMNRLNNAPTASGPTPKCAPQYHDFLELSEILRDLELHDLIRIVTQRDAKTGEVGFYILFDHDGHPCHSLARALELLELDPGTRQAQLIPYHGKEHGPNQIMIDTRSPLSVLYFLSQSVIPSSQDEGWGRVTVTLDEEGCPFNWDEVLGGLMKIHSATDSRYQCAGIAICYRGKIFYIDDSDLDSKSTFQMLTQLLALQTSCPQIPIYTIPLRD